MDLREVGYDDREWINLADDRDRWRAYVRAAMNLRVPSKPVSNFEYYGMKMNANKTKTMVIERKIKKVKLRIGNEVVEQVDSFKYLGCAISSNMSCCQEVKRRIEMAKKLLVEKGVLSAYLWKNN
ncbi:hypothetical protein ANN_07459 [Periplaneta americana]|uniref:Reverse transcriptase n=1 Tax=Periplaneta americana TaxID=6978 RepID=A0ABQ8T0A9_PERAM|nr:hypothetical protein ANN_07459 [Periplaneta americana]